MEKSGTIDPRKYILLFERLRKLGPGTQPCEDAGITPPQFLLLDWVGRNPGSSLSEIAHGLRLTPPTVSVAVRRLEKSGFLERKPDPHDKRSIQIHLTQTGKVLYQKGETYRLRKVEHLLSALAPEDRKQFIILLERAVNAAEAFNKEKSHG